MLWTIIGALLIVGSGLLAVLPTRLFASATAARLIGAAGVVVGLAMIVWLR